jgi:molecular chaperone GrpE
MKASWRASSGRSEMSGELERVPAETGEASREEASTRVVEREEGEELGLAFWKERAQRLQAEIENYRKRQQRLADERILAERERLMRAMLEVLDDLKRALTAEDTDAESLRVGVGMTYQTLIRLLMQEGVEPIEAEGEVFDPTWHEAVGSIPHEYARVEPDTVVEVVREGYRMGDRLLRPARVLVAT